MGLVINQLLPTVSYGDAVSNSAIAISKVLDKMGIKNAIYAENVHPKMKQYVKPAINIPKNQPVIFHMSIGSESANWIPDFKDKKIMIYHNITPPQYFIGYNPVGEQLCRDGIDQLHALKDQFDYVFADSEFNRQELEEIGYSNTAVIPLIINFDEYRSKPCIRTVKKYKADEDYVNFLFVGRIAPNKKQEDIIKTFYYYNKFVNSKSRLFLVGSYNGMERYFNELKALVDALKLADVIFTGHIPFNQILAYYHLSDVFLCMSEHEGFCVPIVEAMLFDLPIIAYRSSAVPATLGNAGFVVSEKNYKAIAELIHIVLNDQAILERLSFNRKARLQELSPERTEKIFMDKIKTIFNIGVQ